MHISRRFKSMRRQAAPYPTLLTFWLFIFCLSLMGWSEGDNESRGHSAASTNGNWPTFRGQHAAGVLDEQDLPDEWNGESLHNIKWKRRIPGLAHASPIIWGDRLIVTSAISSRDEATFRHGLYGDGTASDDRSVHQWKVYWNLELTN